MSGERKLTDRERAFLRVLAENKLGRGLGAGETFYLAFPDGEYRGRRDAGATRTLDSLERRRLVRGSYGGYEATGRDWKITEAGREALADG